MKRILTILLCCCLYSLGAIAQCDTEWSDIQTLLADNGCSSAGCHGGSAGGLNLTSYANFSAGGNKCGTELSTGTTFADIIDTGASCSGGNVGSMNANTGFQIDGTELATIQAWIDGGALEVCPPPSSCPTVYINDNNLPNLPDALCVDGLLSLCFDLLVDETTFDPANVNFGYELSIDGVVSAITLNNVFNLGTHIDPAANGQICFEATLPAGPDPCAVYEASLDIQSVNYVDADCANDALAYDLNLTSPIPLDLEGDDLNTLIQLLTVGGLNPISVTVFPNPNWSYNVVSQPACDGTTGGTVEILAADGTVCAILNDIGTAGADGCPATSATINETYTAFETYVDSDEIVQPNPCAISFTIDETFACTEDCPVFGCTDATACNYDALATDDNGTCSYPTATNLDCDGNCLNDADSDGVCDEDEVSGCTDAAACNYDATATDDNGTCSYPTATNLDCDGNCLNDADADGICDEDEVSGCTDATACNYDATATEDNGTCVFAAANQDCDGNCLNDADADGVCDEDEVLGCTDATACNYDATATDDNGMCSYPTATNLDCDGNCLNDADADGICDEDEAGGCTDPAACNYDATATEDNGTCSYPTATNLDCDGNCLNDADADGVCDEDEVSGCTDATACNYDTAATEDDGTCSYPTATNLDCDGNCLNDADADGICDEDEAGGCTDPTACNYDATATEDNGTCAFATANQDCDGNCLNDADADGICDEDEVSGCTDATACNYDTAATDDDGTCSYPTATNLDCDGNCLNDADADGICDEDEAGGCTDPTACNYDATATEDNGTCAFAAANQDCDGNCINDADSDGICDEDEVSGCTDATACNYDAAATDDDGTCSYPTATNLDCDGNCLNDADADGICDEDEDGGCTDATACNYDATATEDNGTCAFAAANQDCDGNCINDADSDGVCDEDERVGCTDPTACNYDDMATDDGDCIYAEDNLDCDGVCINDTDSDGVCDENEISGCTDPNADNYLATATDDDGSCVFTGICANFATMGQVYCGNGTFEVIVQVAGGSGNYTATDGTTTQSSVNMMEAAMVFGPYDEASVNSVSITINDDDLGCIDLFESSVDCSTTAIELLNFTATAEERGNQINWITATETDNNFFNVMKSIDGVNFTAIGYITAIGNSTTPTSYNLLDEEISTKSYYRLDAVDMNGEITSSDVINVERTNLSTVDVYPVPATNVIYVNLTLSVDDALQITIYDVTGKIVGTKGVNGVAGTNNETVDISGLGSGVYFISINSNNINLQDTFIVK